MVSPRTAIRPRRSGGAKRRHARTCADPVQAVGLPEVAELLGLTDEQRTMLREINRSGPTALSPVNLRGMTGEQRQKSIADWVAARNGRRKNAGSLQRRAKNQVCGNPRGAICFPDDAAGQQHIGVAKRQSLVGQMPRCWWRFQLAAVLTGLSIFASRSMAARSRRARQPTASQFRCRPGQARGVSASRSQSGLASLSDGRG
jgi:hypothetical protein